jgi:hypothetical protein
MATTNKNCGHEQDPFPCTAARNQKTDQAVAGPAGFAIDSTRHLSEPNRAASGFTVSELVSVWQVHRKRA